MEHTCSICEQWEAKTTECRANAPSVNGWPKTKPDDWCGAWLEREITPVTAHPPKRLMDMSRIGINFAYVRDFPDDACSWLECVLATPKAIPVLLCPLFQSPIGHYVTELLPVVGAAGEEDADSALRWGAKQPGGDNPLVGDAPGILSYFDTEEEQSVNMAVLASFAKDHPWVKMVAINDDSPI